MKGSGILSGRHANQFWHGRIHDTDSLRANSILKVLSRILVRFLFADSNSALKISSSTQLFLSPDAVRCDLSPSIII